MSIKVTVSSDHTESPIDNLFVLKTVEDQIDNIDAVNIFTEKLCAAFSTKSSKHKFLILVTRVAAANDLQSDLKLLTSVGAIWEPKKDGYITVEAILNDKGRYLITVFWISID